MENSTSNDSANREVLAIHNFGGLTDAEFEFSRLNIFIGPQASGKSVAAKLFYFFRTMIGSIEFEILSETTTNPIRRKPALRFLDYFPVSAWPDGDFEMRYSFGPLWFEVSRDSGNPDGVSVRESEYIAKFLAAGQSITRAGTENPPPVPIRDVEDALWKMIGKDIDPRAANRPSFSVESRGYLSASRRLAMSRHEIPDDFFALESAADIDGAPSYALRRFDEPGLSATLRRLLRGTFLPDSVPAIVDDEGRRTLQPHWASGQKSALPLALALLATSERPSTLVIEEPEAHLYPSGQREVVRLIARCGDLATTDGRPQYVMTTHSPYLLTALNNLVYAGAIVKRDPTAKSAVSDILGGVPPIDPANLRAYMFENGVVRSIIDRESGLIIASELDKTSVDLGVEFEALMDAGAAGINA